MAKKVTRTRTLSDGTEETIEVKKGCLYYLGMFFLFSFVLAAALHTLWVLIVIVIVLVAGVVGGIAKMAEEGKKRDGGK